ncbi:MAG TPA: sigma-70 family RNA polymerase sigma factor, partial [Microbacteriaceae bacterium]|nr:sigma-70 family RNA polymerase sigma factor [Microbacteriaceae bacterium]
MDPKDRDRLVADYLPLVGYLVSELCARATQLDRDELASAGQFALFQASRGFDPERGVPFGSYARTRISGALADELRSRDWVSRGTRKRIKETLAVTEGLTASLGRAPGLDEIAAALGCDRESVAALLHDARSGPVLLSERADELTAAIVGPEESAEVRERDAFLRMAVETLPERQRLIVTRIYFEDKQVKEVAAELGVTHAAVSLARSEAMRML